MLDNNKCQPAFITRQTNLDYHQRMQINLLTTYQLLLECWSEVEQRQRQQGNAAGKHHTLPKSSEKGRRK